MAREYLEDIKTIAEQELNDLYASKGRSWEIKTNGLIDFPNGERLVRVWEKYKEQYHEQVIYIFQSFLTHSEEISYRSGDKYIYASNVPMYFYALMKIGDADDAIKGLKARAEENEGDNNLFIEFLSEIFDTLVKYLTKRQLTLLSETISTLKIYSDLHALREELLKNLLKVRIELLDKSLNKVDAEINRDEKRLLKRIQDWGFNKKYNALFESIDAYILEDNPHVNSGMINNLRTFMHDFSLEMAEKIAEKNGEQIPKNADTPIGSVRHYLKEKLELTEKEHQLLNKFIGVLSSEGGHSFATDKEYFRLARNVTIELGLFLMTKYERRYRAQKPKAKMSIGSKLFSKRK